MRILIDARLLGSGRYSGVEEYAFHLLNALLNHPSKPELILFYNGLRLAPLPADWVKHPRLKVINWHLPNKFLDFSFRFFNWPRLDKIIPTDCFLSPHFSFLPRLTLPHLSIIHDLSFFSYPDFFNYRQRLWHFKSIHRHLRYSSHLVADSLYTKYDLLSFTKTDPSKISVIYPGLSPEFKIVSTRALLDSFLHKYNLSNPYILYVGSLEPRKNVSAVINAWELLKHQNNQFRHLELVLVSGKEWHSKDIRGTINRSPFRHEIRLIRHLIPADRVFLYNKAKAFVYPSFFEGFGFPPLEAQACGVPVIVSNRTSLSEVVANSALSVDPWRINDLAKSLNLILTDEPLRQLFIFRGLKNSQRFNWPKTADQIISLLKSLANESSQKKHLSGSS